MTIKFPGKLPPPPEWKPEDYDPTKPPKPRQSSQSVNGYISVGTSHDGVRTGPRVAEMLEVASPALPASDPLRAMKGDIGNEVPIRASAANVKSSTPFRVVAATPAASASKPFRVK